MTASRLLLTAALVARRAGATAGGRGLDHREFDPSVGATIGSAITRASAAGRHLAQSVRA